MSFNNSALLSTCSLLLCFVAGSWGLSLTKFEVPPSVVVGEDAELRCQYELDNNDDESSIVVKWFWTPASLVSDDKVLIYQRIAGRNEVVFQRNYSSTVEVGNNDSILLKNIQTLSSGVYECVVSSLTAEEVKRETLTVISSRSLSITKFEVPPIIAVGNDAELKCQYQLGKDDIEIVVVKWYWTPASSASADKDLIYLNVVGAHPVVLQRKALGTIEIGDNDSIVLKNIQPLSSGVYECEVSNLNATEVKQGTLTVISEGTGPVINITEIEAARHSDNENKYLSIVCRADDVAPKPTFKISINGKDINVTTLVEDNDHNGLYKATAKIMLGADYLARAQNEVRCEMYYSDSNVALLPHVAVKTVVNTK